MAPELSSFFGCCGWPAGLLPVGVEPDGVDGIPVLDPARPAAGMASASFLVEGRALGEDGLIQTAVALGRGRAADRTRAQVVAQGRIVHQCRLDVAQAVSLTDMPDHQRQKLTSAGKCIAPARAIHLPGQTLEFKSRHGLEKLTKYSSMVRHSTIPRVDSTVCGETIVSKTAQESGYLYELSGTAVRPH